MMSKRMYPADVARTEKSKVDRGALSKRVALATAVAATLVGSLPVAHADDYTFNAIPVDNAWPTSGNWTSGTGSNFPGFTPTDTATFTTANGTPFVLNLAGDRSIAGLTFSGTANNFVLSPGTPATSRLVLGSSLVHSATGTNTIAAAVDGVGIAATVSGGVLALTNTAAGTAANALDAASTFNITTGATLAASFAGTGTYSTGSNSLGSAKVNLSGGTLALNGSLVSGGLTGQVFALTNHSGATNAIGTNSNSDFETFSRLNARAFTLTPANLGAAAPFQLAALGAIRTTNGVTGYDPDGAGPLAAGAAYPGLDYGNVPATGPDINGVGLTGTGPSSNTYQQLGYAAGTFADQNNLASRFTGKISITSAGDYTFTTRSDDGSMLFINGQLVVNNNQAQGMVNRSGTITLTAGQHDIMVVHYEGSSGAGLVAAYRGPDTVNAGAGAATDVVIPASVLSANQARVTLGNAISVSGTSTVDVNNADLAVMGALDVAPGGTLVRGGNGSLRFTGTTLNGPAGTNTYTVNTPTYDVALGTMASVAGNTATLVKTGSGNLILDSTGAAASLGAGTTLNYDVQAGRLVVVRNTATGQTNNPLGTASVTLSGAGSVLQLRYRTAAATVDNAVSVTANATIEVGSDNAGTITGTLGSTTNRLAIANGVTLTTDVFNNLTLAVFPSSAASTGGLTKIGPGTLRLDTVAGYTGTTNVSAGTLQLNVANALTGPVAVATGTTVNFSATNAYTVPLTNFTFSPGSQVTLGATNALSSAAINSLTFASGAVTQLNITAADALPNNAPVSTFSGSRVFLTSATGIGATDTLQVYPGSILEYAVAAPAAGGSVVRAPGSQIDVRTGNPFGAGTPLVAPGTISNFTTLRLRFDIADDLIGAAGVGGLGANAVVEVAGGNRRLFNTAGNFTLGTNPVFLTQDNAARTINDGAGTLTLGAGGATIASTNAQTLQINENITSGANRLDFGTLFVLNGLLKSSGTVYLTNNTNDFAGATTAIVGGTTLRGQANIVVDNYGAFGSAAGNLLNPTIHQGTIRVDSGPTTADSGLRIGAVGVAGQVTLSVGRAANTFNTTLTLAAPLTRSVNGAVNLFTTSNTLGGAAAGSERIVFANVGDAPTRLTLGATPTTINMVAPWFVNISGSNTSSFVDYDPSGATGFTNATYTTFGGGSLAAATDTTIADVTTAAVTNNATVSVAALRTNQAISGTGTINITSGGLIIQGTTARTIANNLNFGDVEGVLHSNGAINVISGRISGSAGINKTGVSTLTISNTTNDFTGPITINQASLTIAGGIGTLGAAANPIVINGGIFRPNFDGTMAAGTHPVTVNPGGGEISPDGNTRSFTINSTISGGGAVIKNSINPATANEYANVLTLGGTNTYTGGTIIRRGRLVVASDANLGAASGVLTIDNAQFGVTGSFSSARTVVLANTNGLTGTFAGSSVDVPGSSTLEFSGPVIGNNSLSKTGTGTLILSAAGGNGYLGTTSVLAGTLLVNNGGLTGTGGGTVTVLGGATLGGTGSIGSDVVMTGASTLAPGASPGTLDIARSLTLSATGTLAVELAGTTPGDTAGSYDQVNVQQSATLAGGLSASLLNGFEPSASDVFYILSRDSGTGTFNGLAEGGLVNLGGGVTAQITYQANWSGLQATSTLTGGNDVALYNVVIPEPASLSVVGLAAAGLLARRRRRA